jgi:hypothetical protein
MIPAITTTLWIAASIALVGLLVVAGYRVVRGVLRILVDLGDLASTTAKLDAVRATRDLERPQPSVLWPRGRAREVWSQRRDRMHTRREARRRYRIARGKMITTVDQTAVDLMRRTWPHG